MTIDTTSDGKLDVATVIQTTLGIVRRNFGVMLGLAATLTIAPWLLIGLALVALIGALGIGGTTPMLAAMIPVAILGVVAFLVVWVAYQGAVFQLVVSDLAGNRSKYAACISVGLRNALPMAGVVFLSVLAIWAGLILLIVPGIMIGMAFCVAGPVRLVEKTSLRQAFTRSRLLTRGNRWRIFGAFTIYAGIAYAVELLIGALTGGFTPTDTGLIALRAILAVPLSLLASMVTTTGVAVVYAELRRIKDGVGINDLAAVFD